MLYEQTVLSKKPDELISYEIEKLKEGVVTPNIILKDPYNFEFLELNDGYNEKDLEIGLINKILEFLAQMGLDFSIRRKTV